MTASDLFGSTIASEKVSVQSISFDWGKVLGQNKVKSLLEHAIISDRLHKAYLFYGPEGAGKDALAIEFCKALNCLSTERIPCQSCSQCRQFGSLMHPDVKFVFAAPKDFGEKNDAEYVKHLLTKAQFPYHHSAYSATASIVIKQIRELRKIAGLKLFNSKWRVFIISEADRMNEEATNSLLKLLEEPPEKLILILTSSHLDRLLPTIISRCQIVRFSPLSTEMIRAKLLADGIEPQRTDVIASLSLGSYRKAEEILEENYQTLRQQAWELLMAVNSQDALAQMDLITDLSAGKDRGTVKEILQFALLWLRDLQVYQLNQGETKEGLYLHNADQMDLVSRLSQQYVGINLEKTIIETEHSIDLVEKNVYIQLVLINLLTSLKKAGTEVFQ